MTGSGTRLGLRCQYCAGFAGCCLSAGGAVALARVLDEDEPIEHWTLIGDELDLLAGRTGPSKLGLALWLKFFTVEGRFPAGRAELPDEAVGHVASHRINARAEAKTRDQLTPEGPGGSSLPIT